MVALPTLILVQKETAVEIAAGQSIKPVIEENTLLTFMQVQMDISQAQQVKISAMEQIVPTLPQWQTLDTNLAIGVIATPTLPEELQASPRIYQGQPTLV
jgi:hypothetical protein